MNKKLSPVAMLNYTANYLQALEDAKKSAVFVGLPKEKAGNQIYGDGQTVMTIGATHEYGAGDNPERSFLRMPFKEKNDDMGGALLQQFKSVADGKYDMATALGRVGIAAVNIVKAAFRTGGFGKWPKLKQATIDAKGFDDILEDTRVMRNSVTWVVRNE